VLINGILELVGALVKDLIGDGFHSLHKVLHSCAFEHTYMEDVVAVADGNSSCCSFVSRSTLFHTSIILPAENFYPKPSSLRIFNTV
jgi:hypothetical protein